MEVTGMRMSRWNIKRIEKMRTEEQGAIAAVANVGEKIREGGLRWNEYMGDGSEWVPKDSNSENEQLMHRPLIGEHNANPDFNCLLHHGYYY